MERRRLRRFDFNNLCTNNLQTEKLDEEKYKWVAASGSQPHSVATQTANVSHKFYSADLCGGTN